MIKFFYGVIGLGMVLAPVAAHAQVTMLQPFDFYRADNVRAVWDAGDIVSIDYTLVLSGRNENSQWVGYREEDMSIDPEDLPAAIGALAALPGNADLVNTLQDAGFNVVGGDLTFNAVVADFPDADGPSPGNPGYCERRNPLAEIFEDSGVTLFECSSYVLSVEPDYIYSLYARPDPEEEGMCWYGVFFHPAGTTQQQAIDNAVPYYTWGTNATYGACSGAYSVSLDTSPVSGYAAAQLLPFDPAGDPSPDDLPVGAQEPLNQAVRSDLVFFLPGMVAAVGDVTDYYESDAYQGYPQFMLYYGYFAGLPDAPTDEGDCDSTHCSGGDGGGGEGGGGDVSELVDLLKTGVGGGIENLDVPDAQGIADQITDGLADVPCYACEFIDEGYGFENSEAAEVVEGLGDDFFGLFPESGSCSVIELDLIPSKGVAFSIDTCNLDIVKLILEFLIYGSTALACIFIVVPKKTSGGGK